MSPSLLPVIARRLMRHPAAAGHVSRFDAELMVTLPASAATRLSEFKALTGRLRGRLARLAAESRKRLLRSAGTD